MKYLFFLLFLLPCALSAQITTAATNKVPLSADASKVTYLEPTFYVYPTILADGNVRCVVIAMPVSGNGGQTIMDFTAVYLDGLTAAGATTTDKFQNVCEQGVKANLVTLYGSDVFTIL